MSPEQLAGTQVDQRSDIFSAGAVLYELLTLQKAFSGESLVATFTQITTSAPRPLDELVADIDPQLVAIVQRALAKDREQRFGAVWRSRRSTRRCSFARRNPPCRRRFQMATRRFRTCTRRSRWIWARRASRPHRRSRRNQPQGPSARRRSKCRRRS